MAEAFEAAALRHWRDAALLERATRISNSDQLYGFAAECAVKSALAQLPGFVSSSGGLMDRYREHIDTLWERVPLQSTQRRFPGLAAVLRMGNPFQDWTTDHRYADDDATVPTARDSHRGAARRLLGAVGLLGTRAGAAS